MAEEQSWKDRAHAAERALREAREENARLREAVGRIDRWEMPETGERWPDGSPVSYAAKWGSHGERAFIRSIARAALSPIPSTGEADRG